MLFGLTSLSPFCSPIVARNRQNLRDEMRSGSLDVYCHLYLFVSPHLKGHTLPPTLLPFPEVNLGSGGPVLCASSLA